MCTAEESWVNYGLRFFISCQCGKEGLTSIAFDRTFLAPLLLPRRALHRVYLFPLLHCQHLFPVSSSCVSSSCLPVDNHSVVHCYPLVCRQFFVSSSLLSAVMPQSPAIITATTAIARERAGRRDQGPHPRHPRPALPDDAPDVSVEQTHELRLLFHCLLSFICLFMSRFSSVETIS